MFRIYDLSDVKLGDVIVNGEIDDTHELDLEVISFKMPVNITKHVEYMRQKYFEQYYTSFGVNLTFSEVVRCAIIQGCKIMDDTLEDIKSINYILEKVLRPTEDYAVISEIDEYYDRICKYSVNIKASLSRNRRKVNVRNLYNCRKDIMNIASLTNLPFGDVCNIAVVLSLGTEIKFKTYYNVVSSLRKYQNDVFFEFQELIQNNVNLFKRYFNLIDLSKLSDNVKETISIFL